MRIVYFGTSDFAVPALKRLQKDVVLVVSQPDRPSGRGMKTHPSPVKQCATDFGLPVETPEKSRAPDFVERLKATRADAFIVASYGQILSKAVLAVPEHGCFNLHGSVLPKYRGAAPIQYSLLNGDATTGVTLMLMDAGMDTGDMIATSEIQIKPDETAGELHDRLAVVAADLVDEWVVRICTGQFPKTAQDEAEATYAPKVEKRDAELRFDRPANKEFDRYRAFTPFPGAWIETSSGRLKVKTAALSREIAEPGKVVEVKPSLKVAFQGGSMIWQTVQPEGRKPVTGAEFANGARIKTEDCLKPKES